MDLEYSEDYFLRVLFNKMKIRDIMNPSPITIYVKEDLSKAYEKFTERSISHLLVVDRENTLLGLVTPKYIYKVQAPNKKLEGEVLLETRMVMDADSFYKKESLNKHSIDEIMYKTLYTLGPDDMVGHAILTMAKKNISGIPIVDKNKKILGIFTNQEIVNFIKGVLTE